MEIIDYDINISKKLREVYFEEIYHFISKEGLTNQDVIITIMNILVSVSGNIFYSIKDLLPNDDVDYKYIRAAIINKLSAIFEDIQNYKPSLYEQLTTEQLIEIYEGGSTIIKMPDGSERTITKEDVVIKKEDYEKLVEERMKHVN